MKFFSTTNTSLQRLKLPLQLPLLPLLFCRIFQPQIRINQLVNENSVERAYFRKAWHACGMNRIAHILGNLGQFKDETSLLGVNKCQKNQNWHFVWAPPSTASPP